MNTVEFKAWPKIPRCKDTGPFEVTITEKLDGTNSCIIIANGEIVGVQSRNRLITPNDDNFGFAAWVDQNRSGIEKLGDGYHYGEWVGPGIQKNPHALPEKMFFLFNTFRWSMMSPDLPACCNVVPILFQGELTPDIIPALLKDLAEDAGNGETPEGVIVYYHMFRKYTKHTISSPKGKWCVL